MAFENPFLKPSAVRKSALQYLFSDEPTTTSNTYQGSSSASVVDNAFDLSGSADKISAIAANIAQNGGEYNPDQPLDLANYDPVAALNGLGKYGDAVKGAAKFLGLGGFAGIGISFAEQKAANDIDTMLQALQGDTSGQSNLTLSTIGAVAGVLGIPFVGAGLGANKDSVANAKGLASNFDNVEQLSGYIKGTDPAIQNIVGDMFTDWSTITPAQYGTVAQTVSSYVQDQVAAGKSLVEAQRAAANQFTPVASAPAGNNPDEIVTVGTGGYDEIPGLLTGGGDNTPTAPSAGSIWTSADGTPIRSGDGGYVYTGSATAEDRAAGAANPPSSVVDSSPSPAPAPAPAPSAPTTDYGSIGDFGGSGGYVDTTPSPPAGNNPDEASSDSGGGGGGGSSKIVCTAMNEAYGFGSFRNKIWLTYSAKHLSKEHEKGYHALFLPLVNIAYHKQTIASKTLRAVLENIARHRSADLRAEMRGTKRDTLGRAYRAILEPLCYFVGKYK